MIRGSGRLAAVGVRHYGGRDSSCITARRPNGFRQFSLGRGLGLPGRTPSVKRAGVVKGWFAPIGALALMHDKSVVRQSE